MKHVRTIYIRQNGCPCFVQNPSAQLCCRATRYQSLAVRYLNRCFPSSVICYQYLYDHVRRYYWFLSTMTLRHGQVAFRAALRTSVRFAVVWCADALASHIFVVANTYSFAVRVLSALGLQLFLSSPNRCDCCALILPLCRNLKRSEQPTLAYRVTIVAACFVER